MNIYIVGLFFFICLLILLSERIKNAHFSPWIIIPFYLLIVAYSYTPDTEAYEDYFYSIDTDINNIDDTEFAIGFQVFTKTIKSFIGENFNLYMFLYNLANTFLILASVNLIRKRIQFNTSTFNKNHNTNLSTNESIHIYSTTLALVMYFAYFGLYYNSIAIRANITLSLLLFITTILNIQINKIIKISLLVLLFFLSTTFHSTAIIGIPVLLIYFFTKKLSTKVYFIVWITIGIFYFSGLSEFLVNKFLNLDILNRILSTSENEGLKEIDNYRGFVAVSNKISFRFIYLFAMGLYFLKYKTEDVVYYKYINIYFCGLVLGAFFSSMETFGRVLDYFSIYFFILAWIRLEASLTLRSFLMGCLFLILPQLIFVLRIINDVL